MDRVIGTPIKEYTENLAIGAGSMDLPEDPCYTQISLNVTVLLVVSGFWKSMTLLKNVLQDVDLLRGIGSSTTTIDVDNSNYCTDYRLIVRYSSLYPKLTGNVEVPSSSSLGSHTVMNLGTEVTPEHITHRTGKEWGCCMARPIIWLLRIGVIIHDKGE